MWQCFAFSVNVMNFCFLLTSASYHVNDETGETYEAEFLLRSYSEDDSRYATPPETGPKTGLASRGRGSTLDGKAAAVPSCQWGDRLPLAPMSLSVCRGSRCLDDTESGVVELVS